MKKFICIILSLILVCFAFAGCANDNDRGKNKNGSENKPTNEPIEPSAIVASIGEEEITYSVYSAAFNSYVSYMGQFGYDPFASAESLEELQDMVIGMLTSDIVTLYHAKQDGFGLSDEEIAAVRSQTETELEQVRSECMNYAKGEFEKDDSKTIEEYFEEYVSSMTSYYTGTEMNFEEYSAFYTDEMIKSKLIEDYKEIIYAEFVIPDEDIAQWYKNQSETDEQSYTEAPGQYKYDAEYFEMNFGTEPDTYPPTYIPEGYSRIMDIAVYPSGELDDEYNMKLEDKQAIYDECTLLMFNDALNGTDDNAERITELIAKYKRVTEECDAMYEDYTREAREKIDEAYAELESGETFAEVMLEYTEDPAVTGTEDPAVTGTEDPAVTGTEGCEAFKTKGRLISVIHSSEEDWSGTVKDIFKTLSVGEYSAVFPDEDGSFHIIYYVSDEKAGAVELDELHDVIKEIIRSDANQKGWDELMESWKDDTALQINMKLVRTLGRESLPDAAVENTGENEGDGGEEP